MESIDLANYLSQLSRIDDQPEGIEIASRNWNVEELESDAGFWRQAVSDLRGWLNLDGELDVDSAGKFDSSLASALGLGSNLANSDTLQDALLSRVEKALDFALQFLAELEGEAEGIATIATASESWRAQWDEYKSTLEVEKDAEADGPINAVARTWPITEFAQFASDQSLNLSPSYQRADVWPTADAQTLIESVLRGIPLPSVILLQSDTDDGVSYEVVDGKQRLTSILRFIGKHPRAIETVKEFAIKWGEPDLLETFQDDYPAFKRLWKRHEVETLGSAKEKELYFPFKLRAGTDTGLAGQLSELRGKYYSQIADEKILIVGERRRISYIFKNQSEYQIPVIIYKDATSEQVHEVFSLYNKQGKHLNAEEIRNALYHRLPLMRALLLTSGDSDSVEEVAPFLRSEWNDLQSTGRALSELGFGRAGYKRTKLLSWVASVIFYEEPRAVTRSTANQINAFLKQVKEDGLSSPFSRESVVRDAMLLLDHAVDTHTNVSDEVWDPFFKHNKGGSKWQELQLVPVLIAFACASVKYGAEDLTQLVESKSQEISAVSEGWRRPIKTQSREQWAFIAKVVRELLAAMGLSEDDLDLDIRSKFGASGIKILTSIPPIAEN